MRQIIIRGPDCQGEKSQSAQPPTGKAEGPELHDLLEDFKTANAMTAAPRQVRYNCSIVLAFFGSQQIASPEQITAGRLQRYLANLLESGLSPASVRNAQGSLSRFCGFLVIEGLLKKNPCRGLPRCRLEKKLPLYLDEKECAQALEIARANGIFGEVCLALNTGMRLSELRMLLWEDVDWDRRLVLVRKSKSKQPRTIPLNDSAMAALREQHTQTGQYLYVFAGGRGDCLSGSGTWGRNHPRGMSWWAKHGLKPLRDKMPKFSRPPKGSVGRGWHLFRHTFASHLAQKGVSIFKISKWLGHAQVSTTQIYAHMNPSYDSDIELV